MAALARPASGARQTGAGVMAPASSDTVEPLVDAALPYIPNDEDHALGFDFGEGLSLYGDGVLVYACGQPTVSTSIDVTRPWFLQLSAIQRCARASGLAIELPCERVNRLLLEISAYTRAPADIAQR